MDIGTMYRKRGRGTTFCLATQRGTLHSSLPHPLSLLYTTGTERPGWDCGVSSRPSALTKSKPPTSSDSLEKQCFFLSSLPLASGPSCHLPPSPHCLSDAWKLCIPPQLPSLPLILFSLQADFPACFLLIGSAWILRSLHSLWSLSPGTRAFWKVRTTVTRLLASWVLLVFL